MVHLPPDIAYRHLTYEAVQAEDWAALLSGEERQRLATFNHAARRRSFVTGRVAARTLLAEHLGIAPEAVPLIVTPGGCVEAADTSYRVSIAHTGPHAVAAIGRRRLGIDLERIAPRHPGLPRFLLHPHEEGLLEALPMPHPHAVILCWTLKEAVLKARRSGFRFSPKKVRLAIDPAQAAARAETDDGEIWHARYTEHDGCYLAIAFEELGEEK